MTSPKIIRLPYRKPSLIASFLRGRNTRTAQGYRADLEDFRAFLNSSDIEGAAHTLLDGGPGEANSLTMAYRAALIDRALSPATVNRRLASLRSLVKTARTLGLVTWTLEVENIRAAPYRDTRGPGLAGYRLLLNQAEKESDPKRARKVALLHLLFDLGLRRGEVCGLDLADVDMVGGGLYILGKGRTEKERLTLPDETKKALAGWIEIRRKDPGPLFTNFDTSKKGGARLSGSGIYAIIRDLGKLAGIKVTPHKIRHSSITQALAMSGGNVRAVVKFSRHKDVNTVLIYDDNRLDLAGNIARMVAASASL
jgi:integrase/recombinase XerC